MPAPTTPGARLGRAAATLLQGRRPADASVRAGNGVWRKSLARGWAALGRSLGRALHRLGLQLSGVAFLVFALAFGSAGLSGWWNAHPHARPGANLTSLPPLAGVELGLGLLFLYFGVSNLLRAGHRP